MPKTSSTSDTQLVVAGQPSEGLLAKLKAVGEQLTDEQITKVFDQAETERTAFQSTAIVCGVFLLAKKQTLKHGQWLPWTEKFAAQAVARLAARCQFEQRADLSARSLRVYVQLAQHFLADLEQNAFQPDATDLAVKGPEVAPEDVLALETLEQDRRAAVLNSIERFVAGRSLRRMLIDFRRAETAADQDELDASASKRRKQDKNEATGQLDFWEEIKRPLTELETFCESKDVLKHADREFWERLAESLEQQAQRARERAKEMAA